MIIVYIFFFLLKNRITTIHRSFFLFRYIFSSILPYTIEVVITTGVCYTILQKALSIVKRVRNMSSSETNFCAFSEKNVSIENSCKHSNISLQFQISQLVPNSNSKSINYIPSLFKLLIILTNYLPPPLTIHQIIPTELIYFIV